MFIWKKIFCTRTKQFKLFNTVKHTAFCRNQNVKFSAAEYTKARPFRNGKIQNFLGKVTGPPQIPPTAERKTLLPRAPPIGAFNTSTHIGILSPKARRQQKVLTRPVHGRQWIMSQSKYWSKGHQWFYRPSPGVGMVTLDFCELPHLGVRKIVV